MSPEPLILPGDFNFHMDVASDVDAQVFSNLLTSMGLKQHVTVQTHISRHTLDLLITRENDPVICIACVAWRDWGGSNWFLFFSRLLRSFSRASRAKFAASPLVRPARQNRHATQAIICSAPVADLCLSDDASMLCTLSQARLSLVMLLRRYHIAS